MQPPDVAGNYSNPDTREGDAGWQALPEEYDLAPAVVDSLTTQVALGGAVETAADLLAGRVRGRVVVDVHS